ncbi:hypothetical protein Q31b_21450 [Novipirellula aureliae]|uniref:Trm112p-like protein n=1 Tax=Novipirellula aureliae TaxID=2527966 RepID=A0A5C6E2L9_9BACT|nr:hypothetical protein [Novipirellula aureliae]TWU43108.1 hypothetical protein Q31b_21450 [Novipirellula aureliae]
MIDKELLKLLRCPRSRRTMQLAPESLVSKLNEAVKRGELRDLGDQKITQPIDAALMVCDGAEVYPIRGGIVSMVAEEAIPTAAVDDH